MTLHILPTHWYSWDFRVTDESHPVANILLDGSQQIGSVAPESVFTRKAAADLPERLPLPVRMFIVWLTMISWRREQNS